MYSSYTSGNHFSEFKMDDIQAVMKLVNVIREEYEKSREEEFENLRVQGYQIFAIESKGNEETWVVDERIYNKLFTAIDSMGYVPIRGKLTGVRMIRLSQYEEPPKQEEWPLPAGFMWRPIRAAIIQEIKKP